MELIVARYPLDILWGDREWQLWISAYKAMGWADLEWK